MKTKLALILTISVFIISGCIYDPPSAGRDIRIINQTNKGIYVFLDSVPVKDNKIDWVDIRTVNNRPCMFNKVTFINAFAINEIFISEAYLTSEKRDITLYFLADSLIEKQMSDIPPNSFRTFKMRIRDIKKQSATPDSLNIIFLYKDSIMRDYEYNMSS